MKVTLLKKLLILLLFCMNFHTLQAAGKEPDVWEVLRNQMSLNHEISQPAVQRQIRWLAAHPEYVQQVAKKSEPYIYHILTEIKKRGLPGELAIIPIIESAFDPFAYSGAGAAGLWQIMPETAKDLDLKKDWWFDGRRSIRPSTDAALNYLQYLKKYFHGDWLLAFAAYNAGEGTIGRSIKANVKPGKTASFWSLPVPRETKAYIPRLLALAEILKNPAKYKIKLPAIPYNPYFMEVNVGMQIDLNHAAKLAGMSYSEFIKLNPGFNRWTTDPNQKSNKLLIPKEKVQYFHHNLAKTSTVNKSRWVRYQVKKSDTLKSIALRNHTTVAVLKKLNNLKSNFVKPGLSILIPGKNPVIRLTESLKPLVSLPSIKPILQKKRVVHIVQPHENFQILEKKYGVMASEIRVWNKLHKTASLKHGQQLVIWKKTSGMESRQTA